MIKNLFLLGPARPAVPGQGMPIMGPPAIGPMPGPMPVMGPPGPVPHNMMVPGMYKERRRSLKFLCITIVLIFFFLIIFF